MTPPVIRALALAGAAWMVLATGAQAQSEAALAAIVAAWAASAHADAEAEAFAHWNAEGAVPPQCATCHAGSGFRDFHGLDGSAAGTVDAPAAIGGVVDCDTCHIAGVDAIAEVTFPSGVSLAVLEDAATCMTCHQGRSSGPTVAAGIAGMEPDTVNPELGFLNPHYGAAAATNFGAEARGLFEYPGQSYAGRFTHVKEAATCIGCHEPHSQAVRAETCVECHKTDQLEAIRTAEADFDGDGNVTEGIAAEVVALQGTLAAAIARYAREVAGAPIVYAPAAYPYFFADLNGDGSGDAEEAKRENAYKSWTPRLLAAAYNYQFVTKDPGSYAHNARYALQALHDSIADLAGASGFEAPPMARP